MESDQRSNSSHGDAPLSKDELDARGSTPKVTPVPVAAMPVHKFAEFYNMNHKTRGQAIIFNHEHFKDKKLKSRSGTNLDSFNLGEQLNRLGFSVKRFNDLNFTELSKVVNEAAKDDHTESDCFLVAVLSHGKEDKLYSKDCIYKPDILWTPFTADRCPSLAGKPKIFIFQACQGDKFDSGVILRRTETDGSSSTQYTIPAYADFLFAYSTIPGFFSWRNPSQGSWFIQALCQEFQERGNDIDILILLTFVCQRVAINFESYNEDEKKSMKKQIPCFTSMLTRRLILIGNKEEKNVTE